MSETLRKFLHSEQTQASKSLALLGAFPDPPSLTQLRELALDHGLREVADWNLTRNLRQLAPLALQTRRGWEVTEDGRSQLASWGFGGRSKLAVDSLANLRAEVQKLSSEDTRRFLLEAISCIEHDYHRAAVIMTWVAAMHLMQVHIVTKELKLFNDEAKRRDTKWREARNADGLSRLKESEFLDILAAIGVLGSSVKEELQACLKRRNACGHPNSYQLRELTVAQHVETLVLNVFATFS